MHGTAVGSNLLPRNTKISKKLVRSNAERTKSGVDEKAETSDSGIVLQFKVSIFSDVGKVQSQAPRVDGFISYRHTKIYIYVIFQIFNGRLPPRANRWTKI